MRISLVHIDQACSLEDVRRFLILSCCHSFIPEEYLNDQTIFPERINSEGLVYTEVEDKMTVAKIREIEFVKVEDVIAVVYTSKSGSTKLRWERIQDHKGKIKGLVTSNSIMKLIDAGVITAHTLRKKRVKNQRNKSDSAL